MYYVYICMYIDIISFTHTMEHKEELKYIDSSIIMIIGIDAQKRVDV